MAIGILGGTFDPIHIGHLIIAAEAQRALNLRKVIFIPAAIPPHKQKRKITDVTHRYRMTSMAIEDNPNFVISDIEINRSGCSYTIDTIKYLKQNEYKQEEIFLLMGSDSLTEICTWKDYRTLLNYCHLAVIVRNGFSLETVPEEFLAHIHFVEGVTISLSSTVIRKRLAQGQEVHYLLPIKVYDYIRQYGLYNEEH